MGMSNSLYSSQSDKMGVGSGSIIVEEHILTAAHNLFVEGNRAERFEIYLGVDGVVMRLAWQICFRHSRSPSSLPRP